MARQRRAMAGYVEGGRARSAGPDGSLLGGGARLWRALTATCWEEGPVRARRLPRGEGP